MQRGGWNRIVRLGTGKQYRVPRLRLHLKPAAPDDLAKLQTAVRQGFSEQSLDIQVGQIHAGQTKNRNTGSDPWVAFNKKRCPVFPLQNIKADVSVKLQLFGDQAAQTLDFVVTYDFAVQHDPVVHTQTFPAAAVQDFSLLCQQIYDLARIANHPLKPEEMTAFVNRSNQILEFLTK